MKNHKRLKSNSHVKYVLYLLELTPLNVVKRIYTKGIQKYKT